MTTKTINESMRAGAALALAFALAGVGCGVSGTAGTGSSTGSGGATGGAGSTGTGGSSSTTGTGGSASGGSGTGSGTGTGTGTGGSGTGAGGTSAAGSGGTTGAGGTGSGTGAGGSGPSGITVNIGGTNVPKENVIAFIHFGHSNMAGRGVDPAATRPYFFSMPDAHAWMYHSGRGFEPALEPDTAGDGGNTLNGMESGGPGTALVKQAAALAPGKYFVSLGFGQGSAYCSQFLPGALYYDRLIASAKELKGKVTFGGIMIMLGITERHGTQADIDGYPQCINKLVTAVRNDLGEPNLPATLCDYEMGTTGPLAPGSSFYNAIRPKIMMVPTVVSNLAIIPTDNPIVQIQDDRASNDDHHFSLDGHKEYTRRVLQTMKDKGWFPW